MDGKFLDSLLEEMAEIIVNKDINYERPIRPIDFDTRIINLDRGVVPNGNIKKCEVMNGDYIGIGDHVSLEEDGTVSSSINSWYYGIAKTDGHGGDIIEVYTPYEVPEIKTEVNIILNTGESNNYGFKQVEDKYRSQNTGIHSSYSKARINITTTQDISIIFYCNCYTESSSYDYGVISKLDTSLSSNYDDNSNNYLYSNIGTSNSTTYNRYSINIPGDGQEHFIEIKYRKDSSVNNNNDYLQFYYEIGEPVEA